MSKEKLIKMLPATQAGNDVLVKAPNGGCEYHLCGAYGGIKEFGHSNNKTASAIVDALNEYQVLLEEYPELKRREEGLALALKKIKQQNEELAYLRKTVVTLNAYTRTEERDFATKWNSGFKGLVEAGREWEDKYGNKDSGEDV